MAEQSLANHRRFVPMFHFVLAGLIGVHLIWSLVAVIVEFSGANLRGVLVGFSLVILFYYARLFPLQAQDRVIRLEERLRFARLLPEDLQERVEALKPGQWVGLRFASDGEVAELCRLALDQGLTGEQIKKRIAVWRADHFRL